MAHGSSKRRRPTPRPRPHTAAPLCVRRRYGMFKQLMDDKGYQVEAPDIWLTEGNPWEVRAGLGWGGL